jgi:hypothetical protein
MKFYLKSERNCENNSAVKYIKKFGKIIRIYIANRWLTYFQKVLAKDKNGHFLIEFEYRQNDNYKKYSSLECIK